MLFRTTAEVVDLVFESFNRAGHLPGPDAVTRRPDLTRSLLDAIGCPAHDRPAVVVVGSKGKGSTAILTARILQAAGRRVGLITSPHLTDFRERIRLDGRAIPEADLTAIAGEIAPIVGDRIDRLTPPAYLGPNGIILGLGLTYFARAGADVLVIEAGRGGAHDDANVVPHQAAALTPVYREHAEQLGSSIAAIAATKAGAIPPGGWAIVGRQTPEAADAIAARAAAAGATTLWLGREIVHQPAGGRTIAVRTPGAIYDRLPVRLLGDHQADNLAVAIGLAETIASDLVAVSPIALREALTGVRWPGRVDVIAERPLIVADGAVTEESARLAIAAVRDRLGAPVIGVIAVPADKDLAGVCRALAPVADRVIVTATTLNRTLRYPAGAAEIAGRWIRQVETRPGTADAIAAARERAGPAGSILVLGTQSLIAETLIALGIDCLDLW